MARDPKELLDEALKLPSAARAALASSLLESLDEQVDESVEEAWAQEIAKRLHGIDSGQTQMLSWAEARKRILGH